MKAITKVFVSGIHKTIVVYLEHVTQHMNVNCRHTNTQIKEVVNLVLKKEELPGWPTLPTTNTLITEQGLSLVEFRFFSHHFCLDCFWFCYKLGLVFNFIGLLFLSLGLYIQAGWFYVDCIFFWGCVLTSPSSGISSKRCHARVNLKISWIAFGDSARPPFHDDSNHCS